MVLDNSFQYNKPTYLCNTHGHICISVDYRSSDHRRIVALFSKCCRRPKQTRSVPMRNQLCIFLRLMRIITRFDRVWYGKSADQHSTFWSPDHKFQWELGITRRWGLPKGPCPTPNPPPPAKTTRFGVLSPLIVSRDSYSHKTFVRLQIGRNIVYICRCHLIFWEYTYMYYHHRLCHKC